jgi:hypothetical protein
MQLYAKKVSAIASGDYYQVLLDSEDSDEKFRGPFRAPSTVLIVA